jgi:phenylalanyl-tRNA synthetase beta chain
VFLNNDKEKIVSFFGEIHPNILKKIDIKTESLVGFEIFLDNIKQTKKSLNDQKTQYQYSDFQKSERDFAFVIDKNFQAQELITVISNIDQKLIKSVKIFDVYQGENIPEGKKSIALNVIIQSSEKTLNDDDLDRITQLIISTVESKTGAKIRS